MKQPLASHTTFTINRTYPVPPERVFAGFADQALKDLWFTGADGWVRADRQMEFRVGGVEISRVCPPEGPVHSFEAHYEDIVKDKRIVFSYRMLSDDLLTSVSLVTVELTPCEVGTDLVFTEQAAFLDGYDDAGQREEGTRFLLTKLENAVGGTALV